MSDFIKSLFSNGDSRELLVLAFMLISLFLAKKTTNFLYKHAPLKNIDISVRCETVASISSFLYTVSTWFLKVVIYISLWFGFMAIIGFSIQFLLTKI